MALTQPAQYLPWELQRGGSSTEQQVQRVHKMATHDRERAEEEAGIIRWAQEALHLAPTDQIYPYAARGNTLGNLHAI